MTPAVFEQRVHDQARRFAFIHQVVTLDPHSAPDSHDFSSEGVRPVSLAEFLDKVQQILTTEGIL